MPTWNAAAWRVSLRACRGHQCWIGMLLQSTFVPAASCKGFKTAGTKPLQSRPCPQARLIRRPAECSAANVLREAPEVGPRQVQSTIPLPADLHLRWTGLANLTYACRHRKAFPHLTGSPSCQRPCHTCNSFETRPLSSSMVEQL